MAEGNVLVIDDKLVICELLRDVLNDRGYNVDYALSGGEGISKFNEGNFDVIMVDLKMPDMDGITVLDTIKEAFPDIVGIIITGYPSFETAQAALRSGAYDYITKPFNIEEISFVIKRAIDFRNLMLINQQLSKNLEEQNVRLEEKVKERTKELILLSSIARDISSSLELTEVLETVVDRVSKALNLEICSILLLDKETDELIIKVAQGLDEEIVNHNTIKMNESISGLVAKNKEAILVEDIEADERFSRRNNEKYYTHSFISVPLIIRDEVIGVINVNNKKSRKSFDKNDLRFIKNIAIEAAIAVENARLYTILQETHLSTVMALTSAIDAKDHYTQKHSEHVTEYAIAIAGELGINKHDIKEIKRACQLHDIGKIGIQDYILTKPDKLTKEEWEEMKTHPLKSAEILRPLVFLSGVVTLIEQHHERYDGGGYPYGIKGENIEFGARIMCAADSYDAMTTDRVYRNALSREEALEELGRCSGTQFDPKVIEAFLKVLEKNPHIISEEI